MQSGVVDHPGAMAMVLATFAIASLALACEPTVVIGSCPEPTRADAGDVDAGALVDAGGQVGVPWSTSFEDGLCGFHAAGGFCYGRHGASLEVVGALTDMTSKGG